ncbi:MAG: bifunctional 2-C-methyl-D-erythritol 4-phosphate cytidylyltransferase/2-C-methyl-D-erythritol 2,4-cyclodiphosphate synthase [Rhizobiaceae bacterium]
MSVNVVVIVAAGRGQRMGSSGAEPKQYLRLGDRTILQMSIDKFCSHPDIDRVQVVIHADDYDLYDKATPPHPKLMAPVTGGATRQISCRLGLDALVDVDNVLIHDAARPFVSHATISAVLENIRPNECALPGHIISETIKRVDASGQVLETVPRDGLFAAQTPQGFVFSDIHAAHLKAKGANHDQFTDDAAVAEWAGMTVKLIEVSSDNMKITTTHDYEIAERRMQNSSIPDVRTGNGYDIHTLGPGKFVTLCGLEIPHHMGLVGHSDADVGLHALTDALLGTIGDGDIGSHFPPSDAKWKGAASYQFLEHAVGLVKTEGGTITHLDVTLICETPKIGPHREAMRAFVAQTCGIELKRVSIKATTNEKIGAVGRQEGIAALAIATVVFSGV